MSGLVGEVERATGGSAHGLTSAPRTHTCSADDPASLPSSRGPLPFPHARVRSGRRWKERGEEGEEDLGGRKRGRGGG